MEKERLMEIVDRGLESTKGLVKRRPGEAIGTVGATASAAALGFSLSHGDALPTAINATSIVADLFAVTLSYLHHKRTSSRLSENRS